MPRKLGDWIVDYLKYIAPASEAPLVFHTWSAIAVIAASLRRNVFVGRGTYKLYPNLYTVLVGRPGLGKGSAMHPAESILKDADTNHIMSDRMTIEYALERMARGWQNIHAGNVPGGIAIGVDHSAIIVSSELSVFISASQFTIEILTDLWDSKEGDYTYGTRTKGEYKITAPSVNLFGASTQEWLTSSIPSSAVGGGFTRRVNFVVAHNRERSIPWPVVPNHNYVRDCLVDDLKAIGRLDGEFKFAVDAMPLFEKAYNESEPGEFDDEATTSYTTSKWAQVTKIAMAFSASRGDDLIITKDDFKSAYTMVEAVLKNVPKVFRSVGESELSVVMDKVLRFIEKKGFASRKEIMKACWRDIGTNDILDTVMATLKEGGLVFDYVQGPSTLYQLNEVKLPPVVTPPKGTP